VEGPSRPPRSIPRRVALNQIISGPIVNNFSLGRDSSEKCPALRVANSCGLPILGNTRAPGGAVSRRGGPWPTNWPLEPCLSRREHSIKYGSGFFPASAGVCTVSGATYTMSSDTGTCSVIANQAGKFAYTANGSTVTATTVLAVGNYTLSVTFTPTLSNDYTTSTATVQFTVNPIATTTARFNPNTLVMKRRRSRKVVRKTDGSHRHVQARQHQH